MAEVFIIDTTQGIESAVKEMFSHLEKDGKSILKSSKEVYIKVNGIDFKKHAYTSPEVLEIVIKYLKEIGASKIYVMENSTQGNMSRIVFAITGYRKVCKKTGAKAIYLDEEKTETFTFKGKSKVEYILKTFRLPKTIVKLMENRNAYTYINLPKLKTHNMAGVTLGIKNQWGYPQHADRGIDHNYNLHSKIVDVYEYIQPDITIIDGIEGTIHGHYPPTALEDRLVKKFNILIGGSDTVSVDVVGARVFGLTLDDVPHLKIANERGLGEGDLSKINVIGKSLDEYKEKFPTDLLQEFPEDVKIIKGKELCCKEGCQNNPLTTMQVFSLDLQGKGGFFIVMGKVFDNDLVEQLKNEGFTKGLVAGFCAINEIGEKLREEFGKKNVFFSHNCNNLAETINALFKLMDVKALDVFPPGFSIWKLLYYAIAGILHDSKALIPSIF